MKFPDHAPAGTGEIGWQPLTSRQALDTLHNPRYAGAFSHGRWRSWKDAEGKRHTQELPREQWRFFKANAHAGYVSWEQYLENEKRLLENFQGAAGAGRKVGPPREGPALLQGLVVCRKCGRIMSVRYQLRQGKLAPDYVCDLDKLMKGQKTCQRIPGTGIDQAISQLLMESVTPLALEVALQVQDEIQNSGESLTRKLTSMKRSKKATPPCRTSRARRA